MRRILLLAATAASACLGTTASAFAVGLADQRIVPEREPSADRAHSARGSTGLIAPRTACPDQSAPGVPRGVQRRAMRCMTLYARRHAGLASLSKARRLDRSAEGRAADILRCDSFSHFACGRDLAYWMHRSGYRCGTAGENLAWGVGRAGTVRSIFRTWMRSPGHRRNILNRKYRQIGVSLRVGNLGGHDGARVWTQHFGSHCR